MAANRFIPMTRADMRCPACVPCSTCEHSKEPGSIEIHCRCGRFECETCGHGGVELDQCPDCDDGFEERCDECLAEQEYEE